MKHYEYYELFFKSNTIEWVMIISFKSEKRLYSIIDITRRAYLAKRYTPQISVVALVQLVVKPKKYGKFFKEYI